MDNIALRDVFGIQAVWDYYLYVIMFFQLILLFILFATESLRDTMLIAAVVICAFMDKAYLFGYLECGQSTLAGAVRAHSRYAFATMAIRIAMFTLPMVLVTQTKVKAARPLAILLTLLSAVYVGGRWATEQMHGGFTASGTCFTRSSFNAPSDFYYASTGIVCLAYWALDSNRLGRWLKP